MYSRIRTATVCGIDSIPIMVEVDMSPGLPMFDMVGNISNQVREGRERVRTALHSIGILMPAKRITINLSPAKVRKDSTIFDVPIAVALMVSLGLVSEELVKDILFIGELNLSGDLLPVSGVLPIVSDAVSNGITHFVLPAANYDEATLVEGAKVFPFDTLSDLFIFLQEGTMDCIASSKTKMQRIKEPLLDFSEVNGQQFLRRAAEIAAAGMHNLLFIGPPGAGKTMIAERMPSIMPKLTQSERLEISKIYSVRGLLDENLELIQNRPFRNPHHTVTKVGMIGGGSELLPGEISLAHTGVLFLDEMTEFDKETLELLRQPLEDKRIIINRNSGTAVYPADFLLLGAMNPCNCGYYPNMQLCRCSAASRKRYYEKISQPLIDRIDLFVHAEALSYQDLISEKKNESSKEIAKRVNECLEIQKKRFDGTGIIHNSQIPSYLIDKYCSIEKNDQEYMKEVFDQHHLTGRSYHKILRVARTIADLSFSSEIKHEHLVEALFYRNPDEFLGRVDE